MIALAYLAALLGVIGCMALLDHRFRLVFWADARRGLLTLGIGAGVFLIWDVVAIAAGFYHKGDSPAMTGILLAPELPLEELFFIVFLCYLTLVVHALITLVLRRQEQP
ncbi:MULTISPECIES: lycopene cyclase domain-containing protein [unclassified Pseudactinotalea]|uniref:lycopene cyclase domain-containing protein n=1 Tax=Micrococcales TaxID=85006 RepID=UPI003C7AF44F